MPPIRPFLYSPDPSFRPRGVRHPPGNSKKFSPVLCAGEDEFFVYVLAKFSKKVHKNAIFGLFKAKNFQCFLQEIFLHMGVRPAPPPSGGSVQTPPPALLIPCSGSSNELLRSGPGAVPRQIHCAVGRRRYRLPDRPPCQSLPCAPSHAARAAVPGRVRGPVAAVTAPPSDSSRDTGQAGLSTFKANPLFWFKEGVMALGWGCPPAPLLHDHRGVQTSPLAKGIRTDPGGSRDPEGLPALCRIFLANLTFFFAKKSPK